jgi:geranylgeranyl pyrophosphate synthase
LPATVNRPVPATPAPFAAHDRSAVEAFLSRFLNAKQRTDGSGDVAGRYAQYVCRGKMMRALLVVLAYRMGGCRRLSADVLRCAAALELLHSAMLIHDDIIDRSDERRGQPSWHVRYAQLAAARGAAEAAHVGRSMALCAGDIGFFFAFEMLAQLDAEERIKRQLLTAVTRMVGAAGLGELHEMRLALHHNGGDATIFDVYAQKTAGYSCALPLTVGGLLGGLAADTVAELDAIGLAVGRMFQVIDDELDLFGDAEALGKPVGTDVREGRHTLFYALLDRRLPAAEWAQLKPLFGNGELQPEDLRRVRAAVDRAGIRRLIGRHLQRTSAEAMERVAALPVAPAQRESLRRMIGALLARRP